MKKGILFVLIITLLSMIGCETSREDEIRKKFKEYVSLNFDDPKTFKEFVAVEANDTCSLWSMLEVTKNGLEVGVSTKEWCDSLGQIQSKMIKEISTSINPKRVNNSMRIEGGELLRDYYECVTNELELLDSSIKLRSQIEEEIEGITYEPPLYGYSIKIRKKHNDALKLEEYFAYIDSSTNVIIIRPSKLKIYEVSSQIVNLLRLNEEYSTNIQARIKNTKRKSEVLLRLKNVLAI